MKDKKKMVFLLPLLFLLVAVDFCPLYGKKTWQEKSFTDFIDGTFFYTKIDGIGPDAYVGLKTTATFSWWDTAWQYKRYVCIWNWAPKPYRDCLVKVVLNTQELISNNKMRPDGGDIRVVDEDDATELPFRIMENEINKSSTTIWVKIPYIAASTATYKTIYIYYGNPEATSKSDRTLAPPEFSENFSQDPFSSNRWRRYTRNQSGEAVWSSEEGGILYLTRSEPNRAAAVFCDYTLPDTSWECTFRYKVTGYGGGGGEGLVFMFYKNEDPYKMSSPTYGNKLGFTVDISPVVSGYGVEIDAQPASEPGIRNGHYALIKDDPLSTPLKYFDATMWVYDGAWHNVKITFTKNDDGSCTLQCYVDGYGRIEYTGYFDFSYKKVGFCAATGSSNPNAHIIDDFKIESLETRYIVSQPWAELSNAETYAYLLAGMYESNEKDIGYDVQKYWVKISNIRWTEELPPSTSMQVWLCARLTQDSTQYYWIQPKNGDTDITLYGRYISYRCYFFGDGKNTPKFHDITIEYGVVPIAVFTATTTALGSNRIIFDASESYDIDGFIEDYFWDFGDGTIGYGKNVEHTYELVISTTQEVTWRTYIVTLNVRDNDGFTNIYYMPVYIPNLPMPKPPGMPRPKINISTTVFHVGETITLDGSNSFDPTGDIGRVVWAWAYSDNDDLHRGQWFLISVGSMTNLVSECTFTKPSSYTIALAIYDDIYKDIFEADTVRIIVRGRPEAHITSQSHTIIDKAIAVGYGESVTLSALNSQYPYGSIVGYRFDFGDGFISSNPVVTHTYAQVTASYTVKLDVVGDDGLTATDTVVVRVTMKPVPLAQIESPIEVGKAVLFDATLSHDPDGSIVSYHWDFGDGFTSMDPKPRHAYTKEGTYTVLLTVTDNFGLKNTRKFDIVVTKPSIITDGWYKWDTNELYVYPNPAPIDGSGKKVSFSYYLESESDVYVAIFDLVGRLVKSYELLRGGEGTSKGWNKVEWCGRDNSGDVVYSGVYIVKILIVSEKDKLYKMKKFAVYRY
jgi:PKD repeat protein